MNENKIQVSVSGITPAESGEDWFIIDQSGEFSVDRNIIATIWLVGGGCDGTGGVWNGNNVVPSGNTNDAIPNTGTGNSISGSGGDGGFVLTILNVKIPKNTTLNSIIAERNNKSGTSLNIGGTIYKCEQSGCVFRRGGEGGIVPLPPSGEKWTEQSKVTISKGGIDGVYIPIVGAKAPYNCVGSSGGGGAACNGTSDADNGIKGGEGAGNGLSHRDNGTDATNYGCGGGGGAVCGRVAMGFDGGKGKPGCIIICYTVEEEQKTLIVQKHYKKVCNTRKTCNTDYYSNNSHKTCCGSSGNTCGCGGLGKSNYRINNNYTDTLYISKNKN